MSFLAVYIDARALHCQMGSGTQVESKLVEQMKQFRLACHAISVAYFLRPDDLVMGANRQSFIWQDQAHLPERPVIRLAKDDYVGGDGIIELASLDQRVQLSQEAGEVCLIVSSDPELREKYAGQNCVTLKVSDFGEFRAVTEHPFQGRVRVYQDTDDTTILRLFSWHHGVTWLNPYLKKFYDFLLRKFDKDKIVIQQITSRKLQVQQASLYSNDGGELVVPIQPEDTPETRKQNCFFNAVRMQAVLAEVSGFCQPRGITCNPEAIYTGGGPAANPEDAKLKLPAIYEDLLALQKAGQELPTGIFLLDDDFGQLDLGDPEVKAAYEKIICLPVAVNLWWVCCGGYWKESDFKRVFADLQRRLGLSVSFAPDQENSPAKRARTGPGVFGGAPISLAEQQEATGGLTP